MPTSNPRVVPERAQPQVGQAAHGSDAADSPAAAPPLRPAEPAPADSSSPRREVASPVQPAPARLVRINAASAAELELLPDIGPALAARIVEFRIANGPFRGPADLDKVRGIGEKTLTRLAPLISFEVVPPGGG